jgi:hypothetical protein
MNYRGINNNKDDQSTDSKMLKSLDSAQDLQVKGSKFRPIAGGAMTLGVKKNQQN